MTFGERLKTARINASLTQGQLANALNTTSNSVSNWEQGVSKPYADMLSEICRVLKVEANWLLDWKSSAISPAGRRTAYLYDKADDRTKKIVDMTLEPFDNDIASNSTTNTCLQQESEDLYRESRIFCLPLSAGTGIFLDSSDYDVVRVGPEVPIRASFGARISGDSMEPNYPNGHIAWVRMSPSVEPGQVGVFLLNGEGYIKKLGNGELLSLNDKYNPIKIKEGDELRTYGVVVAVTENNY